MPKIIKTKQLKYKKEGSKKLNPVITYLVCSIKGLIFTLIIFLIVSSMIYRGSEFTGFIKGIIYISVISGSFLTGYLSQKQIKNKGIVSGIISSIVYLFLLLFFIIILMRFKFNYCIFILVPISAASAVIGGITSANK